MKTLSSKYSALTSNPGEKNSNPVACLNDGRPEARPQSQTPTSWPWLPLVPAYWLQLALARVTLQRCDGPFGSSIKSEHYADEGIRVVRLQNIGMAAYKGQDSAFLDEAHVRDEIGYAHDVLPGDLLIAGLGDENNPLGRACVAPSDLGPTIVKADCYRFRLDTSKVEPAFVALQLSALAQAECGFIATGSTRQRLNLGLAAARRLVLPTTLEQQRQVVAWLDLETARIDALIEKKTRFIELLREKRQALITQAVTQGLDPAVPMKDSGVEWLGQVPAHWGIKRLRYLAGGLTVGIVLNPSDYVSEDGLPYLYGGDISEDRIDLEGCRRISAEDSAKNFKTQLQAGDLVTVRVGAPGVTSVVPPEASGGNCASVMLIRKGSFDSKWLCYVMNSRVARYQVELVQYGAAQEQFNIGHAVDFFIPTPPSSEQSAIARFLSGECNKMDVLSSATTRSIQLLKERRAALITAAVTGQIDLREAA